LEQIIETYIDCETKRFVLLNRRTSQYVHSASALTTFQFMHVFPHASIVGI